MKLHQTPSTEYTVDITGLQLSKEGFHIRPAAAVSAYALELSKRGIQSFLVQNSKQVDANQFTFQLIIDFSRKFQVVNDGASQELPQEIGVRLVSTQEILQEEQDKIRQRFQDALS